LFTGIGGIDLAAEWAGFETVLQVERDPYCLGVLHKHWPDVPKITDVRDIDAIGEYTADLVSGGFPCQPFSHAGKRGGKEDDRYLWPAMLEAIRAIAPRWVLAENVSGIMSIENGMVIETVLSDLEAAEYETLVFQVPACGVGAPHRRDRVFIVAHTNGAGTRDFNRPSRGRTGTSDVRQGNGTAGTIRPDSTGKDVAQRRWSNEEEWLARSGIRRVSHGVPKRVHRLRALGNAVVPQQVYPILAAIAEMEEAI
jgi:DNA (cytosine-5)-methyltransferase 1